MTTLIDPEIAVLAKNRDAFEREGVLVLAPSPATAELAFDKAAFARHLADRGIPSVSTFVSAAETEAALERGEIGFPLFVKPRTAVGASGRTGWKRWRTCVRRFRARRRWWPRSTWGSDEADVDMYVDAVSGRLVACFAKRKRETRIGGASKTVSFRDDGLFELAGKVASCMEFCGPLDMDLFVRDGSYVVSEVNPRFGGAYLHAYGCGVDFFKLIVRNMTGNENSEALPSYPEGRYMLMYDAAVMVDEREMV